MRKLLAAAGLIVFFAPTFASAAIFCPQLTNTTWKGSCDTTVTEDSDLYDLCQRRVSGTQVVDLQHFLSDLYHPTTDIMLGYFGNKTKSYVRQFQCTYMGICSGDEFSTGYGKVGQMTRNKIQQICATTGNTTPPPPPPPPSPPPISCNLSVSPSTITPGQSATLSWTSNNALSGLITPGVGYVNANGSQSISPLQSTSFQGTFYGTGPYGQTVASCSTQLTVSTLGTAVSATIDTASLTSTTATPTLTGSAQNVSGFGLAVISTSGDKIYASGAITPTNNRWSHTVTQSLANGTYRVVLYSNNVEIYSATLTVNVSGGFSQACTLDGVTWDNASYHTFYSSRTSTNCSAIAQSRWCSMGQIQGDSQYQYANCTPPVDTGNPSITINYPVPNQTVAQNTTLAISWTSQNAPAGSSVTIYPWPIPQNFPNQPVTGTYNLQITNSFNPGAYSIEAKLKSQTGTVLAQAVVPYTVTAAGGGTTANLTASPTSGTAPLTVIFTMRFPEFSDLKIDFGDGTPQARVNYTGGQPVNGTHTYSAAGTYTAKLYSRPDTGLLQIGEATITVSPGGGISAGSTCIYKGQSYPEGSQTPVDPPYSSIYGGAICDNSIWVTKGKPGTEEVTAGYAVCDLLRDIMQDGTQPRPFFNCNGPFVSKATLKVSARHGNAPFTVVTRTDAGLRSAGACPAPSYTVYWGDGANDVINTPICNSLYTGDLRTHTYSSPGSYTISYDDENSLYAPNSTTIRVDGAAALAPKESQLASALTALEVALGAMKALLGY